MITEDYISFETAKLLKEKGFDEPCYRIYKVIANKPRVYHNPNEATNSDLNEIYANIEFGTLPTLQMAMKWLRKNFGLHCQIDCPIAASNWVYGIRDLNEDEWVTLRNMGDYETYEEACEEAIKYCLENLI